MDESFGDGVEDIGVDRLDVSVEAVEASVVDEYDVDEMFDDSVDDKVVSVVDDCVDVVEPSVVEEIGGTVDVVKSSVVEETVGTVDVWVDVVGMSVVVVSPSTGHVGKLLTSTDGTVSAEAPQDKVMSPVGLDPKKTDSNFLH